MPHTYKQLRKNTAAFENSRTQIELVCEHCGRTFLRSKRNVHYTSARKTYCSLRCHGSVQTAQGTQNCSCTQCGRQFTKRISQIRSTNNFCSRSCAATYNNNHKTHGSRRSKLEIWIEEQLCERYPDMEILFNNKNAINSELDIYFPDLGLAFELNGIYHYEPIHGRKKLAAIQNNDHRKFAACAEKDISLCVIDVSAMKYFKPAKGQQFLEIIIKIVEQQLRDLDSNQENDVNSVA